jgi:hypothetical protein
MKSAEYKALIKLGAAILPLLAARLAKGNIHDVIPCKLKRKTLDHKDKSKRN